MNNLEIMRKRFEWQGGIRQEDRMIKDKYRTFQRALQYSYQGADIQLAQRYSDCLSAIVDEQLATPIVRALINPDKVKQDYDDKILSLDYAHSIGPGDVFRWVGTDTNWIVYLEELTEDAYFRGEIRRCRYKIKFKDSDGNWLSTWAAIRGPVETQIDSIQKNQIRVDRPNLSLNIVMPRNEKTLHAFDRYDEFLFAGLCWQVQAPDSISTKNIIQISAEEYYINRDTDDIENEMKNGLVFEEIDPNVDTEITGETWIKPFISFDYSIDQEGGTWSVREDVPVELTPTDDSRTVSVKWTAKNEGQFTLVWTKDDISYERVIVVESLF